MRLDAFDYELPRSLIAQVPQADRSASRLMVVDRVSGRWQHRVFRDLAEWLDPGDVVVVNRSRVVPARLPVRRESGGRAELLFVRALGPREFLATGQPLRKLKPGSVLTHDDRAGSGGVLRGGVDRSSVRTADEEGSPLAPPHRRSSVDRECSGFSCRVIAREGDREVRVEVTSAHTVRELLERFGHVPLPPYIERADDAKDRTRYQTVFAEEDGSVAAPTAGLHFDAALLDALAARGVDVCSVVLHVGLGTFLPLACDVVEENRLHAECFSVDEATLACVREAKRNGNSVIAVGTTTTRVLETLGRDGFFQEDPGVASSREKDQAAAGSRGDSDPGAGGVSGVLENAAGLAPASGETDLFIYPGYEFKVVDSMITNFHLPRSSLLLLVCAFFGRDQALACYEEAVREQYRFFSYGDAMFVR